MNYSYQSKSNMFDFGFDPTITGFLIGFILFAFVRLWKYYQTNKLYYDSNKRTSEQQLDQQIRQQIHELKQIQEIKQQQKQQSDKPYGLGDRMKDYENDYDRVINPKDIFIVRVDGHHFSAFSKKFPTTKEQPFNDIFVKAMIQTAKDLLLKYNAQSVYTHSDEITLIFNRLNTELHNDTKHIFGGRINKLTSLIAASASVRFQYNLKQAIKTVVNNAENSKYHKVLDACDMCIFDARAFSLPEDHEAVNNLIWRSKFDCYRNAISAYAFKYFSKNDLNGISTAECVKWLESVGVNVADIPKHILHGTIIKRMDHSKTHAFSLTIKCTDPIIKIILASKLHQDDIEILKEHDYVEFKQ